MKLFENECYFEQTNPNQTHKQNQTTNHHHSHQTTTTTITTKPINKIKHYHHMATKPIAKIKNYHHHHHHHNRIKRRGKREKSLRERERERERATRGKVNAERWRETWALRLKNSEEKVILRWEQRGGRAKWVGNLWKMWEERGLGFGGKIF